jgi:hypothetical protein
VFFFFFFLLLVLNGDSILNFTVSAYESTACVLVFFSWPSIVQLNCKDTSMINKNPQ